MKMKKNEKKQTFREDVAKMFVEALKEDPIEFIRGWDCTSFIIEHAQLREFEQEKLKKVKSAVFEF